jgi:hypothetical protein
VSYGRAVANDRMNEALLLLNDWLDQPIRLLLLIRLEESDEPPPSGPAEGWHVVLAYEAQLHPGGGRDREVDLVRQLNVGTYELGDGRFKLLLNDLPCEKVLALGEEGQAPHRLAFYLPGSAVVLLIEQLQSSV